MDGMCLRVNEKGNEKCSFFFKQAFACVSRGRGKAAPEGGARRRELCSREATGEGGGCRVEGILSKGSKREGRGMQIEGNPAEGWQGEREGDAERRDSVEGQ